MIAALRTALIVTALSSLFILNGCVSSAKSNKEKLIKDVLHQPKLIRQAIRPKANRLLLQRFE
jgi:hypothetical protein